MVCGRHPGSKKLTGVYPEGGVSQKKTNTLSCTVMSRAWSPGLVDICLPLFPIFPARVPSICLGIEPIIKLQSVWAPPLPQESRHMIKAHSSQHVALFLPHDWPKVSKWLSQLNWSRQLLRGSFFPRWTWTWTLLVAVDIAILLPSGAWELSNIQRGGDDLNPNLALVTLALLPLDFSFTWVDIFPKSCWVGLLDTYYQNRSTNCACGHAL